MNQLYSILVQFDQVWSSLIHFGKIWYKKKQNITAIVTRFVNVATFYSNIFWLKYQFWKNVTLEKWNSGGLNTFGHFLSSLLGVIAIVFSNHAQKWRQICPKVFNPPEFHFSEVTFFQNWYFRTKVTWLDNCSNWANLSKTQLSHYDIGLKSVSIVLNKKKRLIFHQFQ